MSAPSRRAGSRVSRTIAIALAVPMMLGVVACQAAAEAPPRTIGLRTLNDSGVAGTVTFRGVGGRTEVTIEVDPGGNPDMPAHIHPGTCDDLTPQPKFPLENVRDGRSRTAVPAALDDLFAGDLAVNIHRSNDDLGTYTACVDIR